MTAWSVHAASVAGLHHVRTATACQDAFEVHTAGGLLAIAVADGGSRATLAGVGANAAAALALRITLEHLGAEGRPPADGHGWHEYLAVVVPTIVDRFRRWAGPCSLALLGTTEDGALGTTLTVVVAHPPWVVVASIGDGFVVVRRGESHLDLLPPDEHTNDPRRPLGRTEFVTSGHARPRTVVARLPDLAGIAVSTDGLAELGLRYDRSVAQQPHGPFFTPIFTQLTGDADDGVLVRLMASRRISELTTDDKTLVVAVPA